MGLLRNVGIQRWSTTNKQYFIDKGYTFTKLKDEFEVNINDLKPTSHARIKLECDFCHQIYDKEYRDYAQLRSNLYCCPSCLAHMKKTYDANGNLYFVEIPYRNREWLFNEYIIKNRDAKDIAKECKINIRTLREWISILEIPNKMEYRFKDISIDEIIDLYVNQHKTSEEIGALYNTTGNTIISWLKENNIEIPTRSELMKTFFDIKGGRERYRMMFGTMESRIATSCRQRNISPEDFVEFLGDENHRIRTSSKYIQWRDSVFKRDNYTCQCCSQRGGDLNVHHINNFNEDIDNRFEIDNGITLCKKCHLVGNPDSFHSIYGERNNNREQLIEFLENHNSPYVDKFRKEINYGIEEQKDCII